MGKKSILLKVEQADFEAWSIFAKKDGKTLSAWIRRKCNESGMAVAKEIIEDLKQHEAVQPMRKSPDVSVLERGTVASTGLCGHLYGEKACPFPGCRNYKWSTP